MRAFPFDKNYKHELTKNFDSLFSNIVTMPLRIAFGV
jgi:hypothetical protein